MADSSMYAGTDDPDLAIRRKLALSMLEQGTQATPIQSPWQGVNRIVQAMMGGYQLRSLRDEDQKSITEMMGSLPGLGGGSPSPSPLPTNPQVSGTQSTPAATPGQPGQTTGDPLTDFEHQQEGFAPKASWDYKQNSFGYGTKADYAGQTIDKPEAEKRLQTDLGQARGLVQAFAPGASKKQQDALADLTFNAGNKWMAEPLGKAVQAGDWQTASKLFAQYDHAGGSELSALKLRRALLAPNLLMTDNAPAAPSAATPGAPGAVPGLPGGPAGAAPIPPSAVAAATSAVSPQASQVAGPGAPSQPQFDPQVAAQVKQLLLNPRTRALGMEMYQEERKRMLSPDTKDVTDAEGNKRTVMRNPVSGNWDIDAISGKPIGAAAPAAPVPGAPQQPGLGQATSPYAVTGVPPGANAKPFRDELSKKTADAISTDRDKGLGAIEWLKETDEARDLIKNHGHVIGQFAEPQDAPVGGGLPGQIQAAITNIPADIVQAVRKVGSTVPGPQDEEGRNVFGQDADSRQRLAQKFTRLAQAGLKATYGSRVTNIDVNQNAKTVPQITDASAATSLSKLNEKDAEAWRTLQRNIDSGAIPVSSIDPEVLKKGLQTKQIKVNGLTADQIKTDGPARQDELPQMVRDALSVEPMSLTHGHNDLNDPKVKAALQAVMAIYNAAKGMGGQQ